MAENNRTVQFIKVTQNEVLDFLEQARQRIVFVKAGYFVSEVEKLLYLVEQKQIRCDVYVDSDEKSIRYGFGEQKALEFLNKNIEKLNVQSANYIRMAIVIVDDSVLVYSPVALSWEEPPEAIEFPNGFIGGELLAKSLLKQIDGETVRIEIDGFKMDIPTCPVPQKAKKEIRDEIAKTITKLKENPPTDPAKLRETTFYRNTYKLLKMTLHGVNIKDKSISLRPFNVMFPKTNRRLKSSWSVLTSEDIENLEFIHDFFIEANKILQKQTFDAKRFGTLIEVKKIWQFGNCITFQIYVLIDKLLGHNNTKKEQIPKGNGKNLVSLLMESREALIEYMLPIAINDDTCWNKLFEYDRSLYRKLKNNPISEIEKKEAIKQAVASFVDCKLKFPNSEEMIDLIHVDFDYYDISDELLRKEEFIEIIKNFDLIVREYEKGFKTKNQATLF